MDISRHESLKQCYDLCLAIEACGSSPELTDAASKASSLMLQIDALVWQTIDTAEPVEKLLAEASELTGELRGAADRVARYSSKPGDSILEDAANQLDVMVRIAGNLQAQIDFICKEVAAVLGLDVDTPAGTVQSVRSMMDTIELRDKRMAALWDYLNVLVLGKRYIKNDSQERHSWSEMAEWFAEDGKPK